MKIDAGTELYCLIGNPVSKSLSPEIHNYSFKKNSVNAKYLAFNVTPNDLEKAIDGIRSLNIRGCNVTIPHKIDIIKYLDEIDEEAKLLGAVNTVVNKDGRLIGYNTDGKGFVQVLKDKNVDVQNRKVAILGAGGAARAISIILAKEGISEIIVINRTIDKAENLVKEINQKFPNVKTKYESLDDPKKDLSNIDILVNCTSIGMHPNIDDLAIDIDLFSKETIICDIVYKPLKTKLLKLADEKGYRTIDGLNMLTYQAILSEEIWLDKWIGKDSIVEYFKQSL